MSETTLLWHDYETWVFMNSELGIVARVRIIETGVGYSLVFGIPIRFNNATKLAFTKSKDEKFYIDPMGPQAGVQEVNVDYKENVERIRPARDRRLAAILRGLELAKEK